MCVCVCMCDRIFATLRETLSVGCRFDMSHLMSICGQCVCVFSVNIVIIN